MAERPVFVPANNSSRLFDEVTISFPWNPGFAASQKKKNRDNLHEAARLTGLWPLLEVSSKSDSKLGYSLSAFLLKVEMSDGSKIPLECAFQGSKVFENGGPYQDLYRVDSRTAKRDERLRCSGTIIGFKFGDQLISSEPKTAFYDWLYIRALAPHVEYLKRFDNYQGFTDIEFNPERSLNCQARSCAIFSTLSKRGLESYAAQSCEILVEIMEGRFQPPKISPPQIIQTEFPFAEIQERAKKKTAVYHLTKNNLKWELKKEGAKRAAKVFSSYDSAISGAKFYLQKKPAILLTKDELGNEMKLSFPRHISHD